MVSLGKCSGSCHFANDLSTKICVPSKTKEVNVKTFNIITRINGSKRLIKYISCECKCKCNSATFNCNQKWNNKTCQCDVKFNIGAKRIMAGILAYALVRIANLKCITDYSKIVYNEIIYVMDILSTNTKSTNVTSTVSINCHHRKLR